MLYDGEIEKEYLAGFVSRYLTGFPGSSA